MCAAKRRVGPSETRPAAPHDRAALQRMPAMEVNARSPHGVARRARRAPARDPLWLGEARARNRGAAVAPEAGVPRRGGPTLAP
jgi:hypothetical protein